MIALPPSSLTLTQERNTHHSCYHEESLKEKSQLSSGVLLTLAQVVAVVHQVGVEPNLNVEGVSRVAQSAEAQKRRCTKILVVDENLDPQHTLFCREISFVANYAL